MDENLVGYLLQSLDADTQRQVEVHLRTHPESRQRLETLRRFLEPLELDRDGDEPPAGLALRTLAFIAHDRCRDHAAAGRPGLPTAPKVRGEYGPSSGWSWHRRADVLVAAGIVVAFVGLAFAGLGRFWSSYQLAACRDNLRQFHAALVGYSEVHDHKFPEVRRDNQAGIFVPVLNDSGFLDAIRNVDCPAVGQQRPPIRDVSELDAGCYAYSLGFSEQGPGAHQGLKRGDGDLLPIMSDRPPWLGDDRVAAGNSPNHGGRGQNVLHIGGHVDFYTQRDVGVDHDDIFVNRDGRAAAGTSRQDTVLGAWRATPYPGSGE
jgi:hypothetical protein